jgi:hypothetical protein
MSVGALLRSVAVTLPLVVACAGEVPPATPSTPPAQAAPRDTWSRLAEVESWPAVNDTAFATRGHLVKPSHAIVRVSPDARSTYLALVTDSVFPDGTLIAMFHQSRDGSESGTVYAMEKTQNVWTFLSLDPDGTKRSDNLEVCALCHKGGVADHVFGLPRSLTGK